MNKVKFWFHNARPVSLPQSLMPAFAAISLCIRMEEFRWYLAVISVIGVCFAHLSMNLFDDYFDYKKKETGFRDILVREGIRARTEKCPYLTSGQATMKQLLKVCILFGAIACALGLTMIILRGAAIAVIILITAFLGIFYSADPFRLSYRGLGEVVIGIIFGPLIVIGTYIACGGTLDMTAAFTGVCIGLLVINILYTHSVLDYEADIRAEKSTLAGLLKTDGGKLTGVWIFNFVPYLVILLAVVLKVLPPLYLAVLITLPWAVKMFLSMVTFMNDSQKKEVRKYWHGPMGRWDAICKADLDWFLFRWFLARNTLTAFTLVFMIVSIIYAFI